MLSLVRVIAVAAATAAAESAIARPGVPYIT